MEVDKRRMLSSHQLNDADEKVIEFMNEVGGRVTPTWVAEEQNLSRTYVSQRLKRLHEHGHVDKPFRGLWVLTDDPRKGEPPAKVGTRDIPGVEPAIEYAKTSAPVTRSELTSRFHGDKNERKSETWWENYTRPALRESGFEFTRNVGWER